MIIKVENYRRWLENTEKFDGTDFGITYVKDPQMNPFSTLIKILDT